jgi:hypothetical protein
MAKESENKATAETKANYRNKMKEKVAKAKTIAVSVKFSKTAKKK